MGSFGSGPGAEHGHGSPPTSAMTTPIYSARFARREGSGGPRASLCRRRHDAASPRRNLTPRRRGRPRRSHPRQSRMAHHRQARRARQHHPDLPASRAPELNPVENVWQYLRQNWLSNTVFENYDAIIDAACAACKSSSQPKRSRPSQCALAHVVSRYDPVKRSGPRGSQDATLPLPGWIPPSSASLSRTLHQDLSGCMR